MSNPDLKFNGRQDAYVDVRFERTKGDFGRTVIVETNHGTYALSFMELSKDDGRYGDLDIALYDQDAVPQNMTALGWKDGVNAALSASGDERVPVRLIAVLSGLGIEKEGES